MKLTPAEFINKNREKILKFIENNYEEILNKETNIFGRKQPKGVRCSLFEVCQFAGEEYCKICAYNYNKKKEEKDEMATKSYM
jgi:hypothetical protein